MVGLCACYYDDDDGDDDDDIYRPIYIYSLIKTQATQAILRPRSTLSQKLPINANFLDASN